ncbi:Protein Skeletor, isoforms B/C [Orchesella cincta]|uniref:Protein Skeletor, isoforms B/C n=1 Tax=Orchesella cincta TaxID=48709 RepID=A0A1D2NLD3_ORCCI|nr:Protein Skeletor, isoforms B/C [Orchesella cincta]
MMFHLVQNGLLLFVASLSVVFAEVKLGGMESWGFNGVRSGMVSMMSPSKLKIRGFDYSGEGPAVWFMVGKEDDPYNEEFAELKGTIIADENGSCDKLARYRNENIMLTTPEGMNFTDFDYLAVFCTRFNHNFGFIELKRDAQFGQDEIAAYADEKRPKQCPQDPDNDEEEEDKVEEEKEEEDKEEEDEEEDDNKRKRKKSFVASPKFAPIAPSATK